MLSCKNIQRGCFLYFCVVCIKFVIVTFGCNSRLCSCCGKRYSDKWADRLAKKIIPKTEHRHMVFSVPEILWWAVKNNRSLQKVLMDVAARTIKECFWKALKKEKKLEIAKKISNVKSVFDIACGHGSLSKYFLNQGCNVTALDLHNPNIDKCESFTFLQQNIKDYEFKNKFDLNICSLFIHFFDVESAKKLIVTMQKTTHYDGYNLIICMSNKDGTFKEYPHNFYPTEGGLISLYDEWGLVSILKDETEIENHGNLGDHSHNLIFALFKKAGRSKLTTNAHIPMQRRIK